MLRLSWENLFSYNRKILDTTSNRYFFVPQPIELKVLQDYQKLSKPNCLCIQRNLSEDSENT